MDWLTTVGKNIGGDIKDSLGAISRAVICIHDLSSMTQKGNVIKNGTVKALENLMKKQEKMVNSTSSLANLGYSEIKNIAEENGYMAIEVQYNPSSISFTSSVAGLRFISAKEGVGSAGDNLRTLHNIPRSTSMRCKLIFEQINNSDAFVLSSETPLSGSIGDIVGTVSDIGKKITKGKNAYSVKKYMEGFVSLLISQHTQEVIFYWGKTCFHGRLSRVRSNYKMFNKLGEPILGEVEIEIVQDMNKDMYGEKTLEMEQEIWKKRYDNLVSGKSTEGMGIMDKANDFFTDSSIF